MGSVSVIVQGLSLLLLIDISIALDNGLARTPPMGWLSWERFRCNTDCTNDPDNCIGEKLFMDMADAMAKDGFRDAGYEYVIIDDCWLAHDRDSQGRLQPDPQRFPSGIRALADYIHARGLKFGIYGDFGSHTCAGFPGNEYYLEIDAQTYANWTVDYFKMDGCNSEIKQYDDAYPAMGMWLNKTGRPILYSCSWPAYQEGSMQPDYARIAKSCNIWRNFDDIDDSWDSVLSIIDFYGNDKTHFVEVAGPGNFNDPDMLIIGNFGLSWEQQRVQMALWSIMASPLIMSVDLRNINARSRSLLQNRGAIAVNQDPLGTQGKRIHQLGNIDVWTRPILPQGSWAFALMNRGTAVPVQVSVKLSDLGFVLPSGYNVTEVFNGDFVGVMKPDSTLKLSVNPTGVFFGKAILLS